MKKNIIKIISGIILILSLMFAEYRFIMHNINPYIGENNTVYLEIFEHGTLDNSGEGFVFRDYVEAVLELAEAKNLQVIDVYHELGLNAENTGTYLADGCHPNYYGRFKIAEMVWKRMR